MMHLHMRMLPKEAAKCRGLLSKSPPFMDRTSKVNDGIHRDGNGAGHFGYPPAPPLMGWDIIFLNGYGTGLRFFFKPGAGSGIAPPRPAPIIYKIKIKI